MRYKLITKFTATTGVVLLATMTLFTYLSINSLKEMCMQEAIMDADNLGETILRTTHYQMMENDRERVYKMIEEVSGQEGVENIRLLDKDGVINFSTAKNEIGTRVDSNAEGCNGCHAEKTPLMTASSVARSRIFSNIDGEKVLGVTKEISNQESCYTAECHFHSKEANLLGILDVHVRLSGMQKKVSASRNEIITFTITLLATLSLCLFGLIQKLVNRPVTNLLEQTTKIKDGQLDSRISELHNDELGELGLAFNDMTEKLQQAHKELQEWGHTLEEKVDERTYEIEQMQSQLIQSAKLVSLGELVAGIAHEINNPLTGILMFSSLVSKNTKLDDSLKPNVQTIVDETKRCTKIVQNLLDFSRHTTPEKTTCSLTVILEDTLKITALQKCFSGINIIKNYAEDLPRIQADASQLEQVFMNMIINAGQAMPDGGSLTITTQNTPDNHLQVKLSDTGSGISDEAKAKIFDPFFTTKERSSGTGLGLSISYGIIKNHGGNIKVESSLGLGTTFTITLPTDEGPVA